MFETTMTLKLTWRW